MSIDTQQKVDQAGNQPRGTGTTSTQPAQTPSGVRKAFDNQLLGVQKFDMTEEEVKLWDTRVGMAVGLLLLIGGGSALVFGAIKLINWLNS